jgi:hypothetical protein
MAFAEGCEGVYFTKGVHGVWGVLLGLVVFDDVAHLCAHKGDELLWVEGEL